MTARPPARHVASSVPMEYTVTVHEFDGGHHVPDTIAARGDGMGREYPIASALAVAIRLFPPAALHLTKLVRPRDLRAHLRS